MMPSPRSGLAAPMSARRLRRHGLSEKPCARDGENDILSGMPDESGTRFFIFRCIFHSGSGFVPLCAE
ncbi:hypothetical protein DPQ25_04530 [Hydrogeniiclostridium mannosilyticum]|uniref:Uncharacterized protein n=1 Tax=Hydrogeniiclostridium mannosilyticum TaxID=2764322 RepID=A0A328UJ99_9FIRM|nr:hypothetical protein DPQ25_04530 [Hydrogeniiclostridium mannosilyticum]